jgi:hypothetical protein
MDVTVDIWYGIVQRIVGKEDFEVKSRRFPSSSPDLKFRFRSMKNITLFIISAI